MVLAALGAGGCAPEELGTVSNSDESPINATEVRISSLALGSDMEMMREDSVLRVGQSLDVALTGAFRRPNKATQLSELPPGFDDSFDVDGWETYYESLALVAKDGQVILAIYHWERADEDRVEEMQDGYYDRYGFEPASVVTERNEYRFWQSNGVRLMTLRSEGRKGLNYTVALGLDDVMDELRMDYQSASIDAETAEALLNEEGDGDGSEPVESGDTGNTEEPATF